MQYLWNFDCGFVAENAIKSSPRVTWADWKIPFQFANKCLPLLLPLLFATNPVSSEKVDTAGISQSRKDIQTLKRHWLYKVRQDTSKTIEF